MTLHQFNLSRVHGASITLCTDTVKPALTSRALPAVNETLAWTIKLLHCFKTKKTIYMYFSLLIFLAELVLDVIKQRELWVYLCVNPCITNACGQDWKIIRILYLKYLYLRIKLCMFLYCYRSSQLCNLLINYFTYSRDMGFPRFSLMGLSLPLVSLMSFRSR